jgi:hypothetical protein
LENIKNFIGLFNQAENDVTSGFHGSIRLERRQQFLIHEAFHVLFAMADLTHVPICRGSIDILNTQLGLLTLTAVAEPYMVYCLQTKMHNVV